MCFAVISGTGPVGPTGDGGQEKLLGEFFSQININTDCSLFMCSPMTGLYWRLEICCHILCWRKILFCPRGEEIERSIHIFFHFSCGLIVVGFGFPGLLLVVAGEGG